MKSQSSGGGFTTVELLVVIVVIALLVAITLPNLFSIQRRGRDNVRKNDLRNIQNALETYHSDRAGYPTTNDSLSALVPSYLPKVPNDPKDQAYGYESDSITYTVTANLENTSDPAANQSGQYVIKNPGQ